MAVYNGVNYDTNQINNGLKFNAAGTRFYGARTFSIVQLDPTTPWSLAAVTYTGSGTGNGQTISASYLSPDGATLYLCLDITIISTYSVAVPGDITSTLTIQSNSVALVPNYQIRDIAFSPDGLNLYVLHTNSADLRHYSVASAWDLSNVTLVSTISLIVQVDAPTSVHVKPDGTRFYILGASIHRAFQYDLATPWDLTTLNYPGTFYSYQALTDSAQGIALSSTGHKLYVLDAYKRIYEFDLPVLWDIVPTSVPPPTRGIRITGFKKDYPAYISYGESGVAIQPGDDSNTLAAKLQALYLATIGSNVGTLYTTTAASAQLNYSFDLSFTLANATPVPSIALGKNGTALFTQTGPTSSLAPMGHVEGIASGRSRLIAWDIDNLIYWSSATNFIDFKPSAETGANQVAVSSLQGNIIRCEGYTQGFVIYGTGNIVLARFEKSATSLYIFKPVDGAEGVADLRHITADQDVHYYWSSKGLTVIAPLAAKAEIFAVELLDWLKKFRYPIRLDILAGRFLVIYLQDRDEIWSNRAIREGASPILGAKPRIAMSPLGFVDAALNISLYPIYQRALLFDIVLGKWGSCDQPLRSLISLTPYNQSGYQLSKNYQLLSAQLDNEQRELAIRLADGFTRVANTFPASSYLVFGHYSQHRSRHTKLTEIEAEFVDYPTAQIEIEPCYDGAKIDFSKRVSKSVTGLVSWMTPRTSSKWFNILIKGGHYHLKRLIVKGYPHGRS